VIEDSKEELAIAAIFYASIQSFKKNLRRFYQGRRKKRTSSKPLFTAKNDIKFVEYDVSYYDSELKIEVYYLVGYCRNKFALLQGIVLD
jgi:hypothetical protein